MSMDMNVKEVSSHQWDLSSSTEDTRLSWFISRLQDHAAFVYDFLKEGADTHLLSRPRSVSVRDIAKGLRAEAGWRVSDEAFTRLESHQVKFHWAHLEDMVDQGYTDFGWK